MKLALDVHYTASGSVTAGVAFEDWHTDTPSLRVTNTRSEVAEYLPGMFYQRELPCLLQLLAELGFSPTLILIDGYVFLDGVQAPGLGKHLYDALGGSTPIIGIAKTSFASIGERYQLLRGASKKPLFITCAGIELAQAKAHIASMHGEFRLPTLLKTVDQLCRQGTF